jgi:hypothetical protein
VGAAWQQLGWRGEVDNGHIGSEQLANPALPWKIPTGATKVDTLRKAMFFPAPNKSLDLKSFGMSGMRSPLWLGVLIFTSQVLALGLRVLTIKTQIFDCEVCHYTLRRSNK